MEILRNHGPGLLSALGVAGFIGSVVMAVKATPRANEILDEMEEESTFEKVKAVAPVYAPTVGMMFISTACIIASNRAYKQRYASLFAIYSLGERAFDRWERATIDEVGPKRAKKIKERAALPEDDEPPPPALLLEEDNTIFFDRYSGRYFKAHDVETIRRIINNLNDQILSGDWVSLNQMYYEFGLPPTEYGEDLGWASYSGTINADFVPFMENDKAIISIIFRVRPKEFD